MGHSLEGGTLLLNMRHRMDIQDLKRDDRSHGEIYIDIFFLRVFDNSRLQWLYKYLFSIKYLVSYTCIPHKQLPILQIILHNIDKLAYQKQKNSNTIDSYTNSTESGTSWQYNYTLIKRCRE